VRPGRKPHGQHVFPIVDEDECLLAVISRSDLLKVLEQGHSRRELLSSVTSTYPTVAFADESLRAIVYRMSESGFTRLPVVDRSDKKRLIGMVSLADLLRARGAIWKRSEPGNACSTFVCPCATARVQIRSRASNIPASFSQVNTVWSKNPDATHLAPCTVRNVGLRPIASCLMQVADSIRARDLRDGQAQGPVTLVTATALFVEQTGFRRNHESRHN
jgi:CBS-domain-containing membrane protein